MRQDSQISSLADMAALGKIFEQHQARLLEMLQHRLDPAVAVRIDAEGILAETYLLAQQKWEYFKAHPELSEYAWLYQLARDCLIEAWRKHSRDCRDYTKQVPWPDQSSIQLGLSLVQQGDGPATEADRHDLQVRMRKTLGLLKDKDREILWMRHFEHLSFTEAANILGLTENAATVRYVRALNRLRDLWKNLHGTEEQP